MYFIYMYEEDLEFNNPQGLICNKTKQKNCYGPKNGFGIK